MIISVSQKFDKLGFSVEKLGLSIEKPSFSIR